VYKLSFLFATMGYAGYAPGANSRMKDEATPLEQALQSLPLDKAMETLELIEKLTRNVVRNPGEEKFRRIKFSNEKIRMAIKEVPGAVALLKEMGWVEEEDSLVLPPSTKLVHEVHVVGIIEAKDHYKTEIQKQHVRDTRARKELTDEQRKLQEQIEADRKEKAAEGPVTKDSVAAKKTTGANIMRASDLGIGQSKGG
jgi:hypothetical protein